MSQAKEESPVGWDMIAMLETSFEVTEKIVPRICSSTLLNNVFKGVGLCPKDLLKQENLFSF